MKPADELLRLVQNAIKNGMTLIYASAMSKGMLSRPDANAWSADVRHISSILGRAGDAWKQSLWIGAPVTASHADASIGTLKSLERAIQEGTLRRFEDLVSAEVFADLLAQAEYLLTTNFAQAAAVLTRAVLEGKLRRMTENASCVLATGKRKPTIADYEQALGKANVLDKNERHQISGWAAVGNSAAHDDNFEPNAAPAMLQGVRAFLAKHGA